MKTPPRLPIEFVDQVRNANPLYQYFATAGPIISHNDQNQTALTNCIRCKKPDLVIVRYGNVCKCFSCGFSGSVFTVHMQVTGSNFRTAVLELAERAGIHVAEQYRDQSESL